MSEKKIKTKDFFKGLIEPWEPDLFPWIREQVHASKNKLVILDDDPTGTQTVHGLPVLTSWSIKTLEQELKTPGPAFFILTNSRSLPVIDACRLSHEIGVNLKAASDLSGVPVQVISRSDSTLRGHFPDELEPLARELGQEDHPYLLVPFFLEGGRFTLNDIHWVAENDFMIPAAQTSYAADSAFGFSHSNLREWVEEKTRGRIPSNRVTAISLEVIRKGGPAAVASLLKSVEKGTACIVNALSYKDIEVLVAGLIIAGQSGKQFFYRSAASFVRVMTGTLPKEQLLSKSEIVQENTHGGLFVAGSYVPKTTEQIRVLMEKSQVKGIQIDVASLLNADSREKALAEAVLVLNQELKQGRDVLIYTSRNLITGNSPKESLVIGQTVSDAVIRMIQDLDVQPRYLVAKGGITSSDIATKALNIKRAMVMGQILPGVPVWKLGPETRYPGMAYIIFPGNVGSRDALLSIQKEMN